MILLHGGLGHSGNWGYQVPALIAAGYRAILIDSRGHGRSTRDAAAIHLRADGLRRARGDGYLRLDEAAVVGWSDGACTALILRDAGARARRGRLLLRLQHGPQRHEGVRRSNPMLDRCFGRHAKDYARLSATPDDFREFVAAVGQMMETQPNYSAGDLAEIRVPVAIVQSEHDEFIKREHAEYLGRGAFPARNWSSCRT